MRKSTTLFAILFLILGQNAYAGNSRIEIQNGHSKKINNLKFSTDNKFVLTVSEDKTVKIWDTFTGIQLTTLSGSIYPLLNVFISPDKKTIIANNNNNQILTWNINLPNSPKVINYETTNQNTFTINKSATKYAFSKGKSIIIKDLKTDKFIKSISLQNSSEINKISFSADSKSLIFTSNDGTIYIENIDLNKNLKKLYSHNKKNNYEIFDSYVSTYGEQGIIKIWDIKRGNLLKTKFEKDSEILYSNKEFLIGKNYKNNSFFIDKISGKIKPIPLDIKLKNNYGFTLSNDNKYLALSYDNNWQLINIATGKNIYIKNYQPEQIDIAALKGKYISFSTTVNGTEKGVIKRLNLSSGITELFPDINNSRITFLEYNPDGELLAGGDSSGNITLWKSSDLSIFHILKDHKKTISYISFDNESLYMFTGSEDNTIKIWRTGTGSELITLGGHDSKITSLSLKNDNESLLSSSNDKTIRIWDIIDGKVIKKIDISTVVNTAKFSPDGTYFIAGTGDNKDINNHNIAIWDAKTFELTKLLKDHKAKINHIAFNMDGNMISSSSSDNNIIIWEPLSSKKLLTLTGHTDDIFYSAFSAPSKNILISVSRDNSIRFWNLANGKEIARFISFKDDNYLIITPDGYYMGSDGVEKYLKFVNSDLLTKDNLYPYQNIKELNRPDIVLKRIGY